VIPFGSTTPSSWNVPCNHPVETPTSERFIPMLERLILVTLIGMGCGSGAAVANDYPTEARVQYVLECMAKYGGATHARMYQCSCSVDRLAAKLPYADFVEADTYTRGKNAMGERGGILREGRRARDRREKLAQTVAQAEKACFLKTPE